MCKTARMRIKPSNTRRTDLPERGRHQSGTTADPGFVLVKTALTRSAALRDDSHDCFGFLNDDSMLLEVLREADLAKSLRDVRMLRRSRKTAVHPAIVVEGLRHA